MSEVPDALPELLAILATPEFEEFGEMHVASAEWSSDSLVIRAEVDHGDESRSSWQLRFRGVIESHLTVLTQCGLNVWRSDHPAIDQYTDAHEHLHFAMAPISVDGVIGQVWQAHVDAVDGDWIPFERYLNATIGLAALLRSGSGLLATGPTFLINAYASVLQEQDCAPT
jgi:hypothetical protein